MSEPVIDLAILHPETGTRDREVATGKAPLPGSVEHVEWHGGEPDLGPRESAIQLAPELAFEFGDGQGGWRSGIAKRNRNPAHRQRAGPGQSGWPGGQPDRHGPEPTREVEPGGSRRKPGTARIAAQDRAITPRADR